MEWENIEIYEDAEQVKGGPLFTELLAAKPSYSHSFQWNSRDGWRITCEHRWRSSCFWCRWRQTRHLRRSGNSFRLSYSGLFRR